MALVAGSVVVADDGTVTKSGSAGDLYDAFIAALLNPDGTPFVPGDDASGVQIKRSFASTSNLFAAWMVSTITSNAVVTVQIQASSAGDGLQTSATAGSPTTHPATTKTISGTIG